jgi:hypothetical protein
MAISFSWPAWPPARLARLDLAFVPSFAQTADASEQTFLGLVLDLVGLAVLGGLAFVACLAVLGGLAVVASRVFARRKKRPGDPIPLPLDQPVPPWRPSAPHSPADGPLPVMLAEPPVVDNPADPRAEEGKARGPTGNGR